LGAEGASPKGAVIGSPHQIELRRQLRRLLRELEIVAVPRGNRSIFRDWAPYLA